MTTTYKLGKKINFSFFIFHFSLLLMFTSVVSADFTRDDNTKIVTDNETGLQWQDNETTERSWQDAIEYCEALTLGSYDDWRLPNTNELDSIVDDTKYNPSMSPVFQTSAYDYYWSSTTNAGRLINPVMVMYRKGAWLVDFGHGGRFSYMDYMNRTNYNVRCVRGE